MGKAVVPGLILALSGSLLLVTVGAMIDQVVGLATGALDRDRSPWVLPALAIEAMGVLFLAATAWAGLRSIRRVMKR